MPTYIIVVNNQSENIDHTMKVTVNSKEEAQVYADQFVEDYNNLGHDHSTGWIVKSVEEPTVTPPSE